MCISCQGNHNIKISIDGQQVEQADQFKYLGSDISADGYCGTEIRHRIALDKQAFMNEKKLFTGSFRIVKSVLWSMVLYCIALLTVGYSMQQSNGQ